MTLPTDGGSEGAWGGLLNTHIGVGHDADGTHTKSKMLTDMEWSPTTQAGEEYTKFPNGLIIKSGSESVTTGATDTVTFDTTTAFSVAPIVIITNATTTSGTLHAASAHTITTTTFKIFNSVAATITYNWIAIGY